MDPVDQPYREQLIRLLDGVGAHMPFEEAVADFPMDAINAFPPNMHYTPWHLVEHVRLTQRDMLEYVTVTDYSPGIWPVDFWPEQEARANPEQWDASVAGFLEDRSELRAMVEDPERDILAPIPRTPYFARRDAKTYAIAIDGHGKVAWKSNEALGSHVVAVVTEAVADSHESLSS